MRMFYRDSTVWFSVERGFSETYYIMCPVCCNMSIKVTRWEDGTEFEECVVCERMARYQENMND